MPFDLNQQGLTYRDRGTPKARHDSRWNTFSACCSYFLLALAITGRPLSRDPSQPFEVAEVAQGSVNPFGDLGKLQVLSCNGHPQAVEGCYDIMAVLTLDPQAMQLLAVQDPNMSSLSRNRLPPGLESHLSVRSDIFKSD
jgi:hypothetical protein